MSDDPIDRLQREQLIAKLVHYNGRLHGLGVDALITVAEAFDMRDVELRRAVKATVEHLVDNLAPFRG